MKKIILILTLMAGKKVSNAQSYQLKEYEGQYSFTMNSQEEIAEIKTYDNTLQTTCSMGKALLQRVGKDTFTIAALGGEIVFNRDKQQNVIAVSIRIPDKEIALEGIKIDENQLKLQTETAFYGRTP